MIEHKVTANQSFSLMFPAGQVNQSNRYSVNRSLNIAADSGTFSVVCVALFEILKYTLAKGSKDIMRFIWLSGKGKTSAEYGVEAAISPYMVIERNSIAVLPPSAAEVHNGLPIAIENINFAAITKVAETFFHADVPPVGPFNPNLNLQF